MRWLYCFANHPSGIRLLRSGREAEVTATSAADHTPTNSTSAPLTSDGAGTNATADIPDLDMAVDEIDESEDEKNEVCVDEEDDDDD